MLQDRKGFLWFGTANGLNRYDGYSFAVYTNDPSDSTTISDNGILSLYEDKLGNIWIGTVEGVLNKFDRKTGKFTRYYITESLKTEADPDEKYYNFPLPFSRNNNESITVIQQDEKSQLWVGTWGKGLILFDAAKNKLTHFHYKPNEPNGFHSNRIKAILPDVNGIVWVGTLGGGLYKMITDGEKIQLIKYEHDNSSASLGDNKIISLFKDRNDDLWIGTYGGGLNKLAKQFQNSSPNDTKFEKFLYRSNNKNSISNNIVTAIIQDKFGFLWIGTFGGGLDNYDLKQGKFSNFKNNPQVASSLSKDDILSLLEDKSGSIWIGTHLGKGLNKLERSTVKFKQINKSMNNRSGLNDDVVWAITEDENSIDWIGTYQGGLNKYDRRTGKFSYYKFNPVNQNSISDNHVRAIVDDGEGNLWIGTYSGGLNKFNKSTWSFTRYQNNLQDSLDFASNQVQALLIDKEKNLWVGTFGGGLNKIDADKLNTSTIQSKRYVHSLNDPFSISDNRVYSLFEDKDGTIWIGTFGGGLNKFDKKNNKFISYEHISGDESSLSDNRILTIYEDEFGNLWIGTYGGGLQKFDKRTEKFTRFGSRNKMNSSVVYGILEDNKSNLWMSSDNGLFKFNLQTENFTQYDIHDGLQSLEFSGGAYFKSNKGEMFFGGINGFNYFYPDSIRDNTYIPPIVISSVKIFNEPVRGERDTLSLSYSQNFFSFEFSSLDFTNPPDNQYAFMLESFDNDWHYVDSRRRIANYTNLSPGEYIFRVLGSNNDGVWNNEGARIYIKILPPIWRRWWFISFSVLLMAYLIFYFSTVRYRSLLAIEKLKGKLAADLHDNVGSGLTEISILSELASNEVKNVATIPSKHLSVISEKARTLIDNMSDIVWMVNPQRDSFYHLILRLKDTYSDLLYTAGISFKTSNLEKLISVKLPMEYKQNLYLLFKEGINNAIKHSKCKHITLDASFNKDVFELILKDDGIGFDKEHILYGNGTTNMKARAHGIGGELFVNSSRDGTTIKFIGKISVIKRFLFSFIK